VSSPSVDVVFRISFTLIWNIYCLNRNQNGKEKALTLPRRTNGLLIALATIVLTIKISASSKACMVEHPFPTNCLLRMLITFCLYFESARNSSF
jgi:hypothetical protein